MIIFFTFNERTNTNANHSAERLDVCTWEADKKNTYTQESKTLQVNSMEYNQYNLMKIQRCVDKE